MLISSDNLHNKVANDPMSTHPSADPYPTAQTMPITVIIVLKTLVLESFCVSASPKRPVTVEMRDCQIKA